MQNRRKKTSLDIRNISTYDEQGNQGQGQQDFEYEINPSELHKYDDQVKNFILVCGDYLLHYYPNE